MQLMKFHQAPKSERERRLLAMYLYPAMYLYLCRNQSVQVFRLMVGDYLLRRVIRRRIDDKQTSTRNVSSSYHRLMRIASRCPDLPISHLRSDPPFFSVDPCIFSGLKQKLSLLVLEFREATKKDTSPVQCLGL